MKLHSQLSQKQARSLGCGLACSCSHKHDSTLGGLHCLILGKKSHMNLRLQEPMHACQSSALCSCAAA
jgi:hypothetical protein